MRFANNLGALVPLSPALDPVHSRPLLERLAFRLMLGMEKVEGHLVPLCTYHPRNREPLGTTV